MGIQGLLPLLKSIMVPVHIKDFEGCSVAVDTYSWLHKGALSCSKELCEGLPTSKHIDYCMRLVNLLRHYGVKPVLVFDGGLLPMKCDQENKRARSRKESLARAKDHESNGNSAAAYECYQKAVDISPSVAYELIQVLKQENICYVVAPYEADAQMTFLAASKKVDAVITEDSDLIAFGCPRIIYKMDKYGQGVEFQYSKLEKNKELNFTGFSKQMLLEMCILSGCDYLQSLPGMGLKKAHALMKKFQSYDKVIKHLKYNTVAVPPLYEESFRKAILTFQHQRVYDMVSDDVVHLSELPNNIGENLDFLGPYIPQDTAKGIARGDLDPITKMPFQQDGIAAGLAIDKNYNLDNFKPNGKRKGLELPAQNNLLTKYFCFASIEAKRKFIAPRVAPKSPDPVNVSSNCHEAAGAEADSCYLTFSSAITPDPKSMEIGTSERGHTDNSDFAEASLFENSSVKDIGKHVLIQQSGVSMNGPSTLLDKEHESSSGGAKGKVIIKKRNVIMKSRYFKHKSVKDIDQETKNENTLVNDSVANHTLHDTFLEQEHGALESGIGKMITKEMITQGSKKGNFVSGDYCSARSDGTVVQNGYKSVSDITENELRTAIKANVTTVYFEHTRRNDGENMHEKLPAQNFAARKCNNVISGDKYFEESITKRKAALAQNEYTDIANHKFMQADSTFPIQNDIDPNVDDSGIRMNSEEGKFGCNISHLGQYSGIAEKSMENFVAMLSAFTCTSSGSRASGLRAPLKDVGKTCNKSVPRRQTACTDISNFAYSPCKSKAPSAAWR